MGESRQSARGETSPSMGGSLGKVWAEGREQAEARSDTGRNGTGSIDVSMVRGGALKGVQSAG